MLKDNIAYLHFNKAFGTASCGILLENLAATSWKGVPFAGLRTGWMARHRE